MPRCFSCCLVLLALLLGTGVQAQVLRVRVSDSGSGSAVSDATLALLDSAGQWKSSAFSDSLGLARLRIPASGTYSVQVRRMGFAPRVVPNMYLSPDSADSELSVVMQAFVLALPAVVNDASDRCPGVSREDAAEAAPLWNDAKAALFAVSATKEEKSLLLRVRTWERDIDTLRMVLSSRSDERDILGALPFVGFSPELLVQRGYIYPTPDSGYMYYAPGPDLLVSEGFASTHCFWVDPNMQTRSEIYLRFRPIAGRNVSDIEGFITFSRDTRLLRSVQYRYVGQHVPTDHVGAHGEVAFERLPTGRWYISEWALRIPQVSRTIAFATRGLDNASDVRRVVGYKETGGKVISMRTVQER